MKDLHPDEENVLSPHQPFRPWVPSLKNNHNKTTASKESTAIHLYDTWMARYNDNDMGSFQELDAEKVEDAEDVHDLLSEYAILLAAHPVTDGWWHKNQKTKQQQQDCCGPKRMSMDYVLKLYTSLYEQLQQKFPQYFFDDPKTPTTSPEERQWWKNQKKELRQALENELQRNPPCC